jgi:uncharacterized protein
MQHWEILFFFLAIAAVYASVGFGGGSSYLAILTFYAFPFQEMKLTALICNIIVVTGGTLIYVRKKQVNWRKVIPLVAASVPMAYLGAIIKLSQDTFFIILGCSLLAAAVLLWIKTRKYDTEVVSYKANYFKEAAIGGLIGLLSGMVGIGGGIFLSPVLNLMKWDTSKKIAATASLFILVNSISGIAGQATHLTEYVSTNRIALLCVAVVVGGQIGSRMGALKFDHLTVRRVTAVLVFAAGVEVLVKHVPWFK